MSYSTEFNYEAYDAWANRMEWENEPHDEDCSCHRCIRSRCGDMYEREWNPEDEL